MGRRIAQDTASARPLHLISSRETDALRPSSHLLLAALGLLSPALVLPLRDARADEAQRRVGVFLEGAGADAVRSELDGAVAGDDAELTKKVQQGLARRGMIGKLDKHLAPAGKRRALDSTLQAVARELSLDAVIAVVVRKGDVVLIGVSPSGAVLLDATVPSADRKSEMRKAIAAAGLAPAAPATPAAPAAPAASTPAPGPAPESKPAAAEPPPAPPPDALTDAAGRWPVLSLAVGPEVSLRRFRYNDPFTTNLRPYEINSAPGVGASIELFPGARGGVAALRHVGLVGSFSNSIGVSSKLESGASLPTTLRRWRAGLKGRIPIGSAPTSLGIEATYGQLDFRFDNAPSDDPLPEAGYRIARIGAELRLGAGPLRFWLGGGYGHLLSLGPLGERFAGATGASADARLGVALPIASRFEARLWGDYARFFFALNPRPGDRFVAGGALDQFSSVHLDAALSF